MDQATLVEEQIRDGKKLVDLLIEKGVPMTAAAWVKETEGGMWYLYLVTPLVKKGGSTTVAYTKINNVLRALEEPLMVDDLQKRAFGPSSTVGQEILEFQQRYLGRLPRWYDRAMLGVREIDAAYIYPPPPPAPTQSAKAKS